ncbi:hypothetical protein [Lysinibacillus sp. Bpr_S20]|uniref:hypothetical protein n=1 Tax=Lysinibacillus sp. Bpr_S20 TaxID=2933964 RepID=UPI002012A932|nr:hypothetical protein [Lysinibacillus sp. Bpr_S20]MCL1703091.1 hypothetical protein [Lysinibacillus sp. Bpr_S20]
MADRKESKLENFIVCFFFIEQKTIEFCTAKRVTLRLRFRCRKKFCPCRYAFGAEKIRQKKDGLETRFASAATLSMQKKIRLDEFENRFAPAAAFSGQKKSVKKKTDLKTFCICRYAFDAEKNSSRRIFL